ncbi:MAG TPA: hypothetical protein VGU61_20960 [Noviherbaspirillum sp.]|uniref:hypothetical protein n=1 Tax=Noviherbaspirillum sp. TaxID=1926288 RepID=UPI002DDD084D|nr:hypothetical protein [Noviherbaspirillum sp.]HEV2612744.1 hypothetical protein [Noviherbaspirillum sp.]
MRRRRRIGYDNEPGRDTCASAGTFTVSISITVAFTVAIAIAIPGSRTYTLAKLAGSRDCAHDHDLRGRRHVSVHRQQHHPRG